jgi:hypothetical protein
MTGLSRSSRADYAKLAGQHRRMIARAQKNGDQRMERQHQAALSRLCGEAEAAATKADADDRRRAALAMLANLERQWNGRAR